MLKTRILSSLVLLPLALAALALGPFFFAGLVAVAAAIMAWEWERLCTGRFGSVGMVLAAEGVLAAFLAGPLPMAALAVVGGATLAAAGLAAVSRHSPWLWRVAGAPYIGLPVVSLVWLRADPLAGFATVLWLLAVVWATDIGAYAFGRLIGGPKLAPRFSPKKTWAGLIGGMACAAAAGAGMAHTFGLPGVIPFTLFSGLLAIVAQAGDIAESCVKRRFGAKDSSAIIPGHGGVLDRVDGILPVAVLVAAVTAATGSGVFAWR